MLVHTSTFDVFHAETGGTVSRGRVADYPKGTAYERSKQRAEELVIEQAKRGIEVVIADPGERLRPRPVAGDRARPGDPRRDSPPPAGRPAGGMTLVHVDDVAAGHLAAFDRGTPGERYMLADGYARSVRSLGGGRSGRPRLGAADAARCRSPRRSRPPAKASRG